MNLFDDSRSEAIKYRTKCHFPQKFPEIQSPALTSIDFPATYLKVDDDLAHGFAHEPCFGHVPDDGRRQAEQDHEKVRHRQVDDEDVGHGAHRVIGVDRDADQRVADLEGGRGEMIGW